ncbi:MAG: hypothetical protein JXR25_11090 [Pontiellaceae bacterium]|nr:hypothetical protein [Pontiellaceae bacterium]
MSGKQETPLAGGAPSINGNHNGCKCVQGFQDPELPTRPRCGKAFNPGVLDVACGTPLEGLCKNCFDHCNYILQAGRVSLKWLARIWAIDPANTALEDAVRILVARRIASKNASILANKWKRGLIGGAE